VRWPASDVVVAALVASDDSGRTPSDVGEPWATVSGTLGAQFLTWETATAVAGRMLGINPFDQPDVESAKAAARGLLESRPEDEPAEVTENGIEARGSAGLLDGVDTIADAIDALLGRLGPDGYLAVMAYLDSERDASLHGVRDTLSRRTGRPTTFGWGPRFLHSTGQYHKGGHQNGVFLQVTGASEVDLEVPDRPYSLSVLQLAQALGDGQVLASGRPVLRLHLTDRVAGLAQLVEAIQEDGS
jgi:glucose-6-phosphate isomerase